MNPRDADFFYRLVVVAWRRVVWPFLVSIFEQIKDNPDPVKALGDALKKNPSVTAGVSAVVAGVGGAAAGGAIAVASMGFWAGIGYWLGLVSLPLWGPVLGALVGAGAIGGGIYVLLSKLSARDRERLATLYAQTLNIIVMADGVQTQAEGDQVAKIKDRLVAMGVPGAVVERLFDKAPATADAFEFDPTGLDRDLRILVLTDVWLAAVAAGSAGEIEFKAFAKLCDRLQLPDQAESLCARVQAMRANVVRRTPAVATAATYAGAWSDNSEDATEPPPSGAGVASVAAPDLWEGARDVLDMLLTADFSGNAQARRNDILKAGADLAAAATSIAAVATGHTEILGIIAEGYAAARISLLNTPDGAKKARGRALGLAARLGIDQKQATAFLDKIGDVVDKTARETEKVVAKKQPAAAHG